MNANKTSVDNTTDRNGTEHYQQMQERARMHNNLTLNDFSSQQCFAKTLAN